MKSEEKQALICWAHKWLEPAKRMAQSNPNDESAQASMALYEIALAALTAQPVAWLVELHEPMTDDYCREVKTVQLEKPTGHYMACATPLIRAEGHEVQE